ncbi:MAG: hypothetical protein ACRCTY_09465, partial [Candidatus Adiutrix sp.]
MNVFKLAIGASSVYKIEQTNFEEGNLKKPPFYSFNKKGEPVYYAICPRCDNPIPIIGLYKSKNPYGRHLPHSIHGLANYDQEAYDFCPYACPQLKSPTEKLKKTKLDGLPQRILNILKEQFDRVIYLLSKSIGIVITDKLAKAMLEKYLRTEGFLYYQAAITNIPWVFGYMSHSQSLYGRIIKEGTPLRAAIEAKLPDAIFSEKNQLFSKSKNFMQITFCFIKHQLPFKNQTLNESFDFVVSAGEGTPPQEIYRETLIVDETYFLNLINL